MRFLPILLSAFFCLLLKSDAVVLDWSALPGGQTWTNGALTGQFNLDGVAGNDIRIDVVNNSVTQFGGYPQQASNSSLHNGDIGLQFGSQTFSSASSNISVTITFLGTYASGVYANYTVWDVDANSTSYIDRLSFTALNGAAPVALTATNIGGTASNSISGSGTTNPIAIGLTSVGPIGDDKGDVNVSSGTKGVTSLKFVYNNPGPNFNQTQLLALGNITFTPVPEVGASSGSLALCGGLGAFWRRRRATDGGQKT